MEIMNMSVWGSSQCNDFSLAVRNKVIFLVYSLPEIKQDNQIDILDHMEAALEELL